MPMRSTTMVEVTALTLRFYIHARHIADAVMFLLKHGTHGEKYNIKGEAEVPHL